LTSLDAGTAPLRPLLPPPSRPRAWSLSAKALVSTFPDGALTAFGVEAALEWVRRFPGGRPDGHAAAFAGG
jgi:hypothetical protein